MSIDNNDSNEEQVSLQDLLAEFDFGGTEVDNKETGGTEVDNKEEQSVKFDEPTVPESVSGLPRKELDAGDPNLSVEDFAAIHRANLTRKEQEEEEQSVKFDEPTVPEYFDTPNTEPVEAVAPTLASSAMIVVLNRSVPDLIREDKEAAAVLARIKKADPKAVQARKCLIDSRPHKDLKSLSRTIYTWHIEHTVPWGELGQRLVANEFLIDYKNKMEEFVEEFDELKAKFLLDYPAAAGRAQTRLGDLFDPSLFPSVDALRRKVKIRVEYEFIAGSNIILDVEKQAAREMSKQYNDVLSSRMSGISNYIFDKLRAPLTNMVEKLDYKEGEKPTGFQNTLVQNVLQVVDLMGTCNFNNDPQIDRVKRELRNALTGVTPDALRSSETLRTSTKQEVQQIIDHLPTLGF